MASVFYQALLNGGAAAAAAHGQLPTPPQTESGEFNNSGMDVPVDVDSWNAEKVSDWLVSSDLEKFASVGIGIPHPQSLRARGASTSRPSMCSNQSGAHCSDRPSRRPRCSKQRARGAPSHPLRFAIGTSSSQPNIVHPA